MDSWHRLRMSKCSKAQNRGCNAPSSPKVPRMKFHDACRRCLPHGRQIVIARGRRTYWAGDSTLDNNSDLTPVYLGSFPDKLYCPPGPRYFYCFGFVGTSSAPTLSNSSPEMLGPVQILSSNSAWADSRLTNHQRTLSTLINSVVYSASQGLG